MFGSIRIGHGRLIFVSLFSFFIVPIFPATVAHSRPTVEQVVFEDDAALGTADGAEFQFFYNHPVINSTGDVAFRASLRRGPGGINVTADNDEAIFGPTAGPGSPLGLIARENMVGAGISDGAVFDQFRSPLLSDSGGVYFYSKLRTGAGATVDSTNNEALFAPIDLGGFPPEPPMLGLIARTGADAIGTPDSSEFDSVGFMPTFGAANGVATHLTLRTGAGTAVSSLNDQALFGPAVGSRISNFQQLFREDEPAVGVSDGAEFSQFLEATVNDQNDIAFKSFLRTGTGAPVLSGNTVAIYGPSAGTGTPVGLVVRGGDAATSTPEGALFGNFGTPRINELGEVAVSGSLRTGTGAPVTTSNDTAIYATDSNDGFALKLRAREGDLALGATDNALFGPLNRTYFNDMGDVAFAATLQAGDTPLTTDNDQAIFGPIAGPGSPLGMLVREGDVIDEDGATLSSLFTGFQFNNAGDIALIASVKEPTTGNNRTVLLGIHEGETTIIARIGDQFTVQLPSGGTDDRTILGIQFAGSDEGDIALNDSGEVVFGLNYSEGGSGIYKSSVIPETLAGDFNEDGTVDAADYTVWRDGLGTTSIQADYDIWVNNYGATSTSLSMAFSNSPSSQSSPIPEPSTAALLTMMLASASSRLRFQTCD